MRCCVANYGAAALLRWDDATNGTVARRILNFWNRLHGWKRSIVGGLSIQYTVHTRCSVCSSAAAVCMYKNTFKSHALELGRSMMGLAGRQMRAPMTMAAQASVHSTLHKTLF